MMPPVDLGNRVTHVAYADETHHNEGRYRGICMITLKIENEHNANQDLHQLMTDSSVTEFKWQKLRSARERFAAIKIVDYIISKSLEQILRVDVVTWDTADSRHSIQGRSDVRNLRRMYYFLFKDVLCKRWPINSTWKIYPDENSAIYWGSIHYYLSEIIEWNSGELIAELDIEDIIEAKSEEAPLIQAADLFAGLAVYSRTSYECYEEWIQPTAINTNPARFSKSDRERCKVLGYFDELCKKNKLGVSLKQKRGLRTFNPAKPINFWWYEPQSEYDKAPKW